MSTSPFFALPAVFEIDFAHNAGELCGNDGALHSTD